MIKIKIYPKNKEYFKKLIPFAKKIISICKDNKIQPVIYGGFAHFFYTKDENMEVNDIDIIIPKKSFPKILRLLEKNKIKFKYYPQWQTIVIKKGKLKVEVDEIGTGYKTLNESSLLKKTQRIDFYGAEVRMITLKLLEEIYPVAYNRSKNDKARILKKIKHLEKFLGRKLKSEIKIEIRKATPKDANAVASFFRQNLPYFPYVGRKEYPKSKKKRFIDAIKKKEAIFCLAFAENRVIGVCSFFHKKRGRIRIRGDAGITISPQWQGKGVGTKLLKALIKEARKKGLRKLEAEVICKNKPSVALFKKVGFKLEGKKRKTFITDDRKIIDTYVMGLVLK